MQLFFIVLSDRQGAIISNNGVLVPGPKVLLKNKLYIHFGVRLEIDGLVLSLYRQGRVISKWPITTISVA